MQRFKTKYPGVRFKEHPTRKHGIKPDRYFSIYYWLDKKKKEEGLGWASQGWTAQKAAKQLFDLKHSHKTGEGPQTLQERRTNEEERRAEENRDALTFSVMFNKHYLPAQEYKKSWKTEEILYRVWIEPVIGDLALKDISPIILEKIKKNLRDKGRSASSIRYVLAIISACLNFARTLNLYNGDDVVKKVSKPHEDNKRIRFLTDKEAEKLFTELKRRSKDLHDMALLSYDTGLRASEIFNLTWCDVNTDTGQVTLLDTKSGKPGHAYLTDTTREMFLSRERGTPEELIFKDRNGNKIKEISQTFDRAIEDLGFNKGVTDNRKRIVFHSLRHSFASRLVQGGVPIYTVQKLMRHSTLRMTERYSHLRQDDLRNAVRTLEGKMHKAATG